MSINLKRWMQNIDDSTNLFTLNLVGTHDCVTQFIQFPHISRCQDMNIYEQLCLGVRALDIRVEPNGDRLGMVHGIAKAYNNKSRSGGQMDMADVLKHCYKFIEENPSETIVFQFKNDSNKVREISFNNMYNTYIKGNEDKWYLQNKVPTVGEARGKIILLRRCKMDNNVVEYTNHNTGIDFSMWEEQTTAVPEALLMHTGSMDNADFIVQDRFKYKPIPRWSECIKPFLDKRTAFDGTYVICYLSTAGGTKGPYNNALHINPKFMEYPLDKQKYYGTIYVDFPSDKLVTKVIESNF